MGYVFEIDKAVHVCAYLLSKTQSRTMNYMKLLKLLHFANRESIRETGAPMIGDDTYAMEFGPVLTQTCNLIRGVAYQDAKENLPKWAEYFDTDKGYNISLKTTPEEFGELSDYEIDLLDKLFALHEHDDGFKLAELSHDFPEWRRNYVPGTSTLIPLEDIVEAVGRGQDAGKIAAQRHYDISIEQVLRQAKVNAG